MSTSRSRRRVRDNLLGRLRAGEPRFPGIVGFDETVLPDVRAGAARRPRPRPARRARPGQDPADPHPRRPARRVDARSSTGCEINDHPLRPGLRPVPQPAPPSRATTCRSPGGTASERYGEKLATPDTSVGDLIGDVDPIKVAEGRTLGDPETVHYGLVPADQPRRSSRQRAARPRRAHPGLAAQRAGGARHPGPRLRAAAAARPAAGRQRQPRGLHQPRPHHHPAQGPLRRRGAHPLPATASPTRSA